MSLSKDLFFEAELDKADRLIQQYEDHDCSAGPEDGCQVCLEYAEFFNLPEYEPDVDWDTVESLGEGEFYAR